MHIFCIKQCITLIKRSCPTGLKLKTLPTTTTTVDKDKSYWFILVFSRNYSNYYETLGVSKSASSGAIKKAYYAKCKQLHPDLNDRVSGLQNDEFLKVQSAYQVLKLDDSRKDYDAYLKSFELNHYNFTEWKSHKMMKTNQYTDKRDYEKYRTTPPPSKGVDAKWSDFTWKDYTAFFSLLFIVVYIVQTEIKASKVRRRKYFRSVEIHPPEVHKKNNLDFAKGERNNITSTVKPTFNSNSKSDSLSIENEQKQHKLKVRKRSKKKSNAFKEIKFTGNVSDEILKKFEDNLDFGKGGRNNITSTVKPTINSNSKSDSLSIENEQKQCKLKVGKCSKKKPNAFKEIESTGTVSDEILKKLENSAKVDKPRNFQSLTTW